MSGETPLPQETPNQSHTTPWGTLQTQKFRTEQQISEPQFVKLEDLAPIFNDPDSYIVGHGTATSGDGHDVVEAIFTEGLQGYQSLDNMASTSSDKDKPVGSTDLTDTTIGLYIALDGQPADFSVIREKLSHWPHRDAENIILAKLPIAYTNLATSVYAEKYAPYFVQKRDHNGQMRNYLDPRFIIGNYNRTTGLVELNDQFENSLSDDFRAEMDTRLAAAQSETASRLAALEATSPLPSMGNSETDPTFYTPNISDAPASWDDLDDTDWD